MEVVEHVVPYCFIKQDFLGFADLIACHKDYGILAIQATGGGHLANRIEKIKGIKAAAVWMQAGGRIAVHDWVKVAGTDVRKVKITELSKSDLIKRLY